jgi:ketosteroid isomerase-like protein
MRGFTQGQAGGALSRRNVQMTGVAVRPTSSRNPLPALLGKILKEGAMVRITDNACPAIAACTMLLFSVSAIPQIRDTVMTTRSTVEHFNEVFNRHDADALASLLTDDTVFEDTSPAPDGKKIEGKAAVVEFWRGWFVRNPDAQFEAEEIIVANDRVVVLWIYRKMRNGQPWHLRGIDVFTVRDGKVAAKLAYV